jgi:DNA-binding phage protein
MARLQGTQGPQQQLRFAMGLTRSFRETVQARASRDPAFRKALLREAVQTLLEGDVAGGRAVLRDYINATLGFDALAEATKIPAKSLMRMFGPNGNPTAIHLFAVLDLLQSRTGVHLDVRSPSRIRAPRRPRAAGPPVPPHVT